MEGIAGGSVGGGREGGREGEGGVSSLAQEWPECRGLTGSMRLVTANNSSSHMSCVKQHCILVEVLHNHNHQHFVV